MLYRSYNLLELKKVGKGVRDLWPVAEPSEKSDQKIGQ